MNEQNIPIDIHVGKLLEWLVSRRIVQKNWHTKIPEIRNRIANAVNDMPAHDELVKLLSGGHIHYFRCVQIIEILKTTEADTKSVFGRYGSQRMKEWQEIARLYERDSVYIAEAAQILVRNVNFELPSVKKQLSKFDQLVDDAQKKIHELTTSESVLLSQRAALCQKLGIDGKDLRAEFTAKVKELPKLHADVAASIGKLEQALNLYALSSKNDECLPIIRYVLTKGNTTVYEYAHGEVPLSVEEPPIDLKISVDVTPSGDDAAIDFGGEEIDFGNDIDFGANVTLEEGGDIDWGEDSAAAEVNEIDYNISLEDSGIKVEGSGLAGGIAKNDEALTVLDSPSYREQFLDELFELEAFLKMRLFELSSLENSNSFLMIDGIDNHTIESISTILADVHTAVIKATSELLQHLHQLKHSEKYADILAGKLQQKVNAVDKIVATKKLLKEKIETLKTDKIKTNPLVGKLTEQTKVLQNEIEQDISKRYKNRLVNIMGGISQF